MDPLLKLWTKIKTCFTLYNIHVIFAGHISEFGNQISSELVLFYWMCRDKMTVYTVNK